MSKNFAKNYFGLVALLISWSIPLVFNFSITDEITQNDNLKFTNYLGYFAVWALMLLPSIVMTWAILTQYSIRFNNTGILRMFPSRKMIIDWREIKEIEVSLFSFSLKSTTKTFRINLLIYKNPKELVDFINNCFKKTENK